MKKQKIFITAIISLFLVSLVSAAGNYFSSGYSSWGSSYSWSNYNVPDLLSNQWVVFGAIFALTFAIVYLALQKFFYRQENETPDIRSIVFPAKDEKWDKGPAVVISIVIAFFVAASFSQRAYMYGLLGKELSKWVLTFAAIVGIFLFIMLFFKILSWPGIIISIAIIITSLALLGDPYNYLPQQIAEILSPLLFFINAIIYTIGSGITIIIIAIMIMALIWIIFKGMGHVRRARGRGASSESPSSRWHMERGSGGRSTRRIFH